jgi:aspartyl protease family protein
MESKHLYSLLFIVCCLFEQAATAVEKVAVLGLFPDKAMLRIDGKNRLLRVGQVSPEGVTLVFADSEQAIIEVNGERRTLSLCSRISSRFTGPKVKTVRLRPDVQGMYSVNGTINGQQIEFLVDTGSNAIALNADDARRMKLDYKNKGKKTYSETASGREVVYLLNLETVAVGQITLNNVEAVVFDSPFPSRALLGQTFLNRIKLKRDGAMMELEQK